MERCFLFCFFFFSKIMRQSSGIIILTTVWAVLGHGPQPTAAPNISQRILDNSPECSSTNLSTLTPPLPTGILSDAIQSALSTLAASCTRVSTTYPPTISCPTQIPTGSCAVTALLPSSVLPAYSSYGGSALDWWTTHSSVLQQAVTACWDSWQRLGTKTNLDIMAVAGVAACYGNLSRPALDQAGLPLSTTTSSSPAASTASADGPPSTVASRPSNSGSAGMQLQCRGLLFVIFAATIMSIL